jgi:hypothetical protein
VAEAFERAGDAAELGRVASAAGVSLPSEVRWLSLRPVLKPAAPASSASRTSARIAAMSSAPRGLTEGALAHHRHPHRVVRHLHQEVEAVRHRVERVHELRKALPTPADAFGERRAGMSSTPSISLISSPSRPFRTGAKPTPQLPITTVVAP